MNKNLKLKRIALIGTGILGTLIMLHGITVVVYSRELTTIPVHHLLHAGMAVGAGMLAMVLATLLPPQNRERSGWVYIRNDQDLPDLEAKARFPAYGRV